MNPREVLRLDEEERRVRGMRTGKGETVGNVRKTMP
jgi:hypothetical protein